MVASKNQITEWLLKNRDTKITNNPYLTEDQQKELFDSISDLLSDVDRVDTDEDMRRLVLSANSIFSRMNISINRNRYEMDALTLDEFRNICNQDTDVRPDFKRIMTTFDLILTCRDYKLAMTYMNEVKFTDGASIQVPYCVILSSEPISPLLRPIPPHDEISEFMRFRYDFYNKAILFLNSTGNSALANDMPRVELPDNYDKLVGDYDAIYEGHTPKLK